MRWLAGPFIGDFRAGTGAPAVSCVYRAGGLTMAAQGRVAL
jgi:hypothetical protein